MDQAKSKYECLCDLYAAEHSVSPAKNKGGGWACRGRRGCGPPAILALSPGWPPPSGRQ